MHEVLVNRLGGLSLPRKSVVRLTDRADMTLDVYRGRKTTIQQQQQQQQRFVFSQAMDSETTTFQFVGNFIRKEVDSVPVACKDERLAAGLKLQAPPRQGIARPVNVRR